MVAFKDNFGGPITSWAGGPSQREDLCLALTLRVLEQESQAEPPLSSCNSSGPGIRWSYSCSEEELLQNTNGNKHPHHCLSKDETTVGPLVWGLNLDPLVFFFSLSLKGNENSIFMWLIVSIRSFSNPSTCGCSRLSPKTVCYEYFHISQEKNP